METNNVGTLFGREIGQCWGDLKVWEDVLNEWPRKLDWIMELGTWKGGMSYYLHTQCQARDMSFITFDIDQPTKFVPGFVRWDIANGIPDFVDYFSDNPGILFCDNGNKPREVKLLLDEIHPESLVAVHDWLTEFKADDIPKSHRPYCVGIDTVFLARNDVLNEIESRREK